MVPHNLLHNLVNVLSDSIRLNCMIWQHEVQFQHISMQDLNCRLKINCVASLTLQMRVRPEMKNISSHREQFCMCFVPLTPCETQEQFDVGPKYPACSSTPSAASGLSILKKQAWWCQMHMAYINVMSCELPWRSWCDRCLWCRSSRIGWTGGCRPPPPGREPSHTTDGSARYVLWGWRDEGTG